MSGPVAGGLVQVQKGEEYSTKASLGKGGSGDMTDLKTKADFTLVSQKPDDSVWSTTTLMDNKLYKEDSLKLGIGDGDKPSFPPLGSTSEDGRKEHSLKKDGEESDDDVNNLSVSVSQAGKKYIITKRNLIVNYLPQTFTDRQLFNLFVSYGAIDSVKIMRDATTGYSYGFGFVNFVTEEDGIRARSEMNATQVENKRIKVSFARPPSDDIKDTNLYVTNLPRNITEEDLFALFAPFGEIVQRKLLVDRYTNLPRGVAFIRFERRDQAAAAINALNNYVPQGAEEPIRIRLAEDHGKQKAAYLAGFRAGMGLPNGTPGGGGFGKPMNSRPAALGSYSGKRSMDAWNYEKRNRTPPCNPLLEGGYWTTDGIPSSVPSGHYIFPGGGSHSDQHTFCESSSPYSQQRKRKRFR